MNDRELLELAAKATSYEFDQPMLGSGPSLATHDMQLLGLRMVCGAIWNPLTDDGYALRLAVKLRLQVTPGTYLEDQATAYGLVEATERVHYSQDLLAATRRAIVRAAAAISEGLAPFPSADEIRENWT